MLSWDSGIYKRYMEKNPIKAQRLIASKSSKQSVKFFLKSLSETNDETKINNIALGIVNIQGSISLKLWNQPCFVMEKNTLFNKATIY